MIAKSIWFAVTDLDNASLVRKSLYTIQGWRPISAANQPT